VREWGECVEDGGAQVEGGTFSLWNACVSEGVVAALLQEGTELLGVVAAL
jgi:hypothetical protein